ncbi:hypothetical protein UMM65_13180 [Aureibaculum sp. 2210JD6-5]|uniref:hypothetical protein n=1 Tax=Aureibaculum sp. 2210JD6-5 TaxID=3103957 RepID=UPI002AADEA61|nr:hypothetical protein [Aureibaculum sp. 2210JD6-5]MDY7396198.1 hypothetical protein [Aureibaculum sp. 2210JD6-5]
MKILIFFLMVAMSMACSNSDDSIEFSCYKGENRKITAIFTNAKGKIIGPGTQGCQALFTIKDDSNKYTLTFSPCNLDDKFKEDGLNIVFSGYLFETFETEDVCAFPFELTKIDKLE